MDTTDAGNAPPTTGPGGIIRRGNAVILLLLAIYFLLIPAGVLVFFLADPNLRGPGTPRVAWWAHRRLSPRYERWARSRLDARAANPDLEDISGTEWPLFGSVFYLWATESLEQAWQEGDHRTPTPPSVYARGAIDAAAALVTDSGHAAWVREHWGKEYLHRENVFYRMLLINAATSHAKLLGSDKYLPLLRDQVETLSAELDESPHGLLEDYPGECYPTDVLAAIAAIRRADAVLGTDHSDFVARARRGFEGAALDPLGLPPYAAIASTGEPHGPSRGCANSYMTLTAPELWPDAAREWYACYERHFWQHRLTAYGFREFPKGMPDRDWYFDVDSGPVIAGHGVAACAFGAGGARANGRFDHAWPLSAEMLVSACPLVNGAMAGPRFLSNAVDAPYLGEAAILYALTRQPVSGVEIRLGGGLPLYVWILLALYSGIGGLVAVTMTLRFRRCRRSPPIEPPAARLQFALWAVMLLSGAALTVAGIWNVGLCLILAAQLLPRGRVKSATDKSLSGQQG